MSWVRGRYFLLLAAIIVLGGAYPLLEGGTGGGVAWTLALWFVLLGALRALRAHRRMRAVAAVFGLAALGTGVWMCLQGESHAEASNTLAVFAAANGLFLGLATAVILGDVLLAERVDANQMFGVVCAYLLIGLSFAFLYLLIDALTVGGGAVVPTPEPPLLSDYLYFSFATLTTVGYGDLAPVGAYARLSASVEAVVGMLFLTILVARLVGLHIAHGREG